MDAGSTRAVVLIGKPDCHLCDAARVVVAEVCAAAGVPWSELSILDDPALADEYWERIPVVLLEGRVIAQWQVDPGDLRARLTDR